MQIRDRIKEFRRIRAGDLCPNPANWRKHPQAQQDALRGILAEVGYVDALMVRPLPDGSLQIVDGHLRAETTPDTEVPCLIVDLDDAEAAKVLATFDPLSAMAETNAEKLDALLRDVDANCEDLQKMLAELADDAGLYKTPEVVEDEVQPPRAVPITKPGDLWLLGQHRLLCGDNALADNLARLFGEQRADLIVTSPPYNQDIGNFSKSGMHKETKWVDQTRAGSYADNLPEEKYQQWQVDSIKAWARVVTETASMFYNHKNRFRDKQCISPWRWLDSTGFKIRQEIIWMREGSVTQNMRGFMPCDERIYWMYFGKEFLWIESTEHKSWSTVWRINSQKDRGGSVHGCAFPVELPARAIRACSTKGMIVFEPYCGSGTTLVVAEQLERRCYACELAPQYCDVIIQRWETLTGQKATLEQSCQPSPKNSVAQPKPPGVVTKSPANRKPPSAPKKAASKVTSQPKPSARRPAKQRS